MKKHSKFFILVASLFMLASTSDGQVIVATVPLGSCFKCKLPLEAIAPKSTKIPAYMIFPKKYEWEAEDIEEAHGFLSNGYVVIYNDNLYKRLNKHLEGSVGVLGNNGTLYLHQSLQGANSDSFKSASQNLLANSYLTAAKCTDRIRNGCQYHLRRNTGNIYKVCGDEITKFSIPPNLDSLLVEEIPYEEGNSERLVHRNPIRISSSAKGSLMSFNIVPQADGFDYFIYNFHPVYRDKTVDTNYVIQSYMSVLKYKNGQLLSHSPVCYDWDKSYQSFLPQNFGMIDSTSFFVYALPLDDAAKAKAQKRFGSVYVKKGGAYHFDRFLPATFPPDIAPKHYYSRTSLHTIDYPWYMVHNSSYLHNLETGTQLLLDIKTRKGAKPTDIFHFDMIERDGKVFILTRLDGEMHLVVCENNTGAVISNTTLVDRLFKAENIDSWTFNEQENTLFTAYQDGTVRLVPLELLMN